VTRSRLAASVVLLVAVLPACGVRGLNFVSDDRVDFISPPDRAKVGLPVTIAWKVADFEITGPDGDASPDAGYFGVYVDRAPQPPSQTQEWLVRNDQSCRQQPGCPDEAFLAQRNIHATSETSFVIERLPQPSGDAQRRREFHEVTVVLLDGRGERIGESAFVRQFEVDRGAD
jgi:hypothetical protein